MLFLLRIPTVKRKIKIKAISFAPDTFPMQGSILNPVFTLTLGKDPYFIGYFI